METKARVYNSLVLSVNTFLREKRVSKARNLVVHFLSTFFMKSVTILEASTVSNYNFV